MEHSIAYDMCFTSSHYFCHRLEHMKGIENILQKQETSCTVIELFISPADHRFTATNSS